MSLDSNSLSIYIYIHKHTYIYTCVYNINTHVCMYIYILYILCVFICTHMGFPGGTVVKSPPVHAGEARRVDLIPGSRRSSEVWNGNPLQYSCLENSMDRGAWWAKVHGVAHNWATEHTHRHTYICVCIGLHICRPMCVCCKIFMPIEFSRNLTT